MLGALSNSQVRSDSLTRGDRLHANLLRKLATVFSMLKPSRPDYNNRALNAFSVIVSGYECKKFHENEEPME